MTPTVGGDRRGATLLPHQPPSHRAVGAARHMYIHTHIRIPREGVLVLTLRNMAGRCLLQRAEL
jgi:hypothetical protein